ncbi:MAG: hypothetical protein AMXMBFR64_02270 [Myxococcales bacterium]
MMKLPAGMIQKPALHDAAGSRHAPATSSQIRPGAHWQYPPHPSIPHLPSSFLHRGSQAQAPP